MNLPFSASRHHCLQQEEAVTGPIKINIQKESKVEAWIDDIEATKSKEGENTYLSHGREQIWPFTKK